VPNIEIQSTSQPDLPILAAIDHAYQTAYVWQMDRTFESGQYGVNFHEIRLPRAVQVDYPRPLDYLKPVNMKQGLLLAAYLGGRPIAYIRLKEHLAPRTIWVTDMAVCEDLRRQGVGSALVLAAQDWTNEQGHKQVILEMQSKNFAAICLAQKLGYELCGYNDHYYANQDIALFFARNLR
jgi:GNAT superfamily N-acetyltransferase